ncbi:hypothetical protein G6F55_002084 [Rhizopus delemar]|uniref:Protein kinase domain-containing protein n=2 Tax=Rhizopus TaxID=4842 RepID=A0A9P6Z9T7_9FUNG|nr:hypothetical protein G6F55_002084 [Rhizopus delemar]KAG1528782.1 hypothetical protein G6F52_000338 [Rhizopus delemar]KAG1549306.1 hypothetical protein G6F51_003136 [Rhizopus arrhizus]KAG1573356.1 hypothetical protein G6F50_002921 [Rhizopus delemar]KAG1635551.1 hypothetical protein G6F45_001937 [Rhizopus arrhizus]
MSGTFASIEKETADDGTLIAVKTYSKSHGRLVYEHYQREINALKKLSITNVESAKSKHVVYLINIRETPTSYQLLFPFYSETLGTMSKRVGAESRRTFAYEFVKQISKGLSFLHSNDIIHCDLSPSNILMDTSGCMFISDLGCSHLKEILPTKHEEIGTRWYKAPEHLFGYQVYTSATDIWSLGVIFAELLIGEPLFSGESDLEQIGIIVRALDKPSAEVQKEMSIYPDMNKLVFFNMDDYSDCDISDGELDNEYKLTLAKKLINANIELIYKSSSNFKKSNLHDSIPLTTEEPVRQPWLKKKLEQVNRQEVDENRTGEEEVQNDLRLQNNIQNVIQSDLQTNRPNMDMMTYLSREISDYHERVENETAQYETDTRLSEDSMMNDPELCQKTESNKFIPYDPTPPISRETSSNSIRKQNEHVHNELLVFSNNPTIIEDVNKITVVQYYGAGKNGIIPSAYRNKRKTKSYLVACDFSEESINAMEWTMGAMMRDGDEIHVAAVSNHEDNPEIVKVNGLDKNNELNQMSNALTTQAKSLLDKMLLFNIKLVTHAIVGRIKDRLNGLMREYNYTMVVCGSRGRSPVKRLLMGSISTYLVHTSSVPVAVIKKQKPKKQEVKQASGAHSLSESMKTGRLHVDELS